MEKKYKRVFKQCQSFKIGKQFFRTKWPTQGTKRPALWYKTTKLEYKTTNDQTFGYETTNLDTSRLALELTRVQNDRSLDRLESSWTV